MLKWSMLQFIRRENSARNHTRKLHPVYQIAEVIAFALPHCEIVGTIIVFGIISVQIQKKSEVMMIVKPVPSTKATVLLKFLILTLLLCFVLVFRDGYFIESSCKLTHTIRQRLQD
jgi:ABC-type transport system involved in multi-copper enzyme maturation permease subunit